MHYFAGYLTPHLRPYNEENRFFRNRMIGFSLALAL